MPYDCNGHQPTISSYLLYLRETHGIVFNQKPQKAPNGDMYEAYKVVHNGVEVVLTGLSQGEWLDPMQIAQYDRRLGI